MASDQELSAFLKGVERRAFKRTAYTVRDDDAALDIVQDAMIRLAQRYADRPAAEWPMLFQRILTNATMDWFRQQKVRAAHFVEMSELEASSDSSDESLNLMEVLSGAPLQGGEVGDSAADVAERAQTLRILESEISNLPARQREAFLLRYWEDFDVSETAQVMGCSEGSVKTHCFRAVQALAKALKSKGISL